MCISIQSGDQYTCSYTYRVFICTFYQYSYWIGNEDYCSEFLAEINLREIWRVYFYAPQVINNYTLKYSSVFDVTPPIQ